MEVAVLTKVYRNATGSFAMTFDVLDGTTQTSDLQSALSLAATIDPTPITQSAAPVVFTKPVV